MEFKHSPLESAIGVARLLGMEADDVTRQINVHKRLGPPKKNVLASQLNKSHSFARLSSAVLKSARA